MTTTSTEPVAGGSKVAGALLLDVRQLEVTYNRVAVAVQGVSLEVPEGGIVAILGSNGAGKTTTLRAISGFLPGDNADVTDGEVLLDGRTLHGLQPHQISRLGVSIVPERDKVFTTLTVAENLRAVARPQGDIDELVELFPVLRGRENQQAGYLSGGERQMLAIVMALASRPRLLLADEISLGIAPILVERLMDALVAVRDTQQTTVLLVEQNAASALRIADYAYIMESGRIVYDGTPERLIEHEDVREFYLGVGDDSAVRSYADVKQYRRKRRWFG